MVADVVKVAVAKQAGVVTGDPSAMLVILTGYIVILPKTREERFAAVVSIFVSGEDLVGEADLEMAEPRHRS